jgi:hypothetical protein
MSFCLTNLRLSKSSSLAAALGVTKFVTMSHMVWSHVLEKPKSDINVHHAGLNTIDISKARG